MKPALYVMAALVGCAASAWAADKPTLTLHDLRKQVSISAPQIAPGGGAVAILVRRNDYDKDRTVSDLVLIDTKHGRARTLIRDSKILAFKWSPSGDAIAYVATPKYGDDKGAQLFVLPMNGGEPVAVTHEKNGVSDFAWRPDGEAFAYSADVDPPNQKAIDKHDDTFDVKQDAWTAQSAPTQTRLYEINRTGGRRSAIGDASLWVAGSFVFAGDGRHIFVTRLRPGAQPNQYLATQIVRIDIATGAASPIAALSGTQFEPIRSLDGRGVAYQFVNPHGSMQTELAQVDADGQHPKWITRVVDRDVSEAAFAPGGTLVIGANNRTTRVLYTVDVHGHIGALPTGELIPAGDASLSRRGDVAFLAETRTHPFEVYLLRAGTKVPSRLTNYNAWIDRYALGSTRPVTWRTSDGLQADGALTAPPNARAGRKYPLVLVIHGGPTSSSTVGFSSFIQVLAAHGWYVFQPNYRGSNNLGLRFATTTVPHIASVPGSDIEAGLATVLRSAPIDESRIGVSGWSEGGLMTSWLITHDARWKAAVSGAAVNDWTGYAAMTDAKDFTPQFIGRSPWTDPTLMNTYDAESPLTYASNVKTPTLILSDAGDFRVPTPLSYEFYHAIRATGTPVQFVVWPVVGHFPSDPVRVEDVYRHWEAWLVKYM
jgi:dipeptidyl aminopeptidase/acylaminoacyl peptidase